MRPLVVVETGRAALDDARGELLAVGWSVSSAPRAGDVLEIVVADDASAADAVLSAVAGQGLLVEATAHRAVVDRLCDGAAASLPPLGRPTAGRGPRRARCGLDAGRTRGLAAPARPGAATRLTSSDHPRG